MNKEWKEPTADLHLNLGSNIHLWCGFSKFLTSLALFFLLTGRGETSHHLEAMHFTFKMEMRMQVIIVHTY